MTCNSAIEANIIKTRLIDEEIDCFLVNETFTTLMPAMNGMFGAGVQVMIDEKDSERAKEILKINDQTAQVVCPYCNSENVKPGLGKNKFKKILLIIVSILAFIPFNNLKQTYYCKNCQSDFNL